MKAWILLSSEEKKLLLDIKKNGPECAKFLARRYSFSLERTMDLLKHLKREGWLRRVQGTFLEKKGLKKPKHMNHTYYEISRPSDILMRKLTRSDKMDTP